MLTSEVLNRRLTRSLKSLHLPTVRAYYGEHADQARREERSYEHYLLDLIEQECEVRLQNRVQRLLQASKLPLEKTMAAFDRSRLPAKVNAQISVLLEGGFLNRTENILAFGNPGSGKTHLVVFVKRKGDHLTIEKGTTLRFVL